MGGRVKQVGAGTGLHCVIAVLAVSFCIIHPNCKGRILPSASGKSVLIDNSTIGGDVIFDSVIKGGKPQNELFEMICKVNSPEGVRAVCPSLSRS